jgi:hypothetical protein
MEKWLDIGAALFALVASVFWFLSAYGKIPPMIAYWGQTPESDPFYAAIRFSAEMNKLAAGLSGFSGLCMGLRLFVRRH